MAGVSVRAASDAPKLVCRRRSEPNTRRLFDSSEPLDDIEPVLENGVEGTVCGLGFFVWFGSDLRIGRGSTGVV